MTVVAKSVKKFIDLLAAWFFGVVGLLSAADARKKLELGET
ncbi:hypothetical protein [Deinococcus sp.]